MITIPGDVSELIARRAPALVVTATKDGIPNAAFKGSLSQVDESTLVYADLLPGHTTTNVMENPSVSVIILEPGSTDGYQLKGRAELTDRGELFHQACDTIAGLRVGLPMPQAVVIIHVDEIIPLAPRLSMLKAPVPQ